MSDQAYDKLLEEIFTQCDVINTLFESIIAKPEGFNDADRKEFDEALAKGNVEIAKAVAAVEGFDSAVLTMTNCKAKFEHKCSVMRLIFGGLVLTLCGQKCLQKMPLQEDILKQHRAWLTTKKSEEEEVLGEWNKLPMPDKCAVLLITYAAEINELVAKSNGQEVRAISNLVSEANRAIAETTEGIEGITNVTLRIEEHAAEDENERNDPVVKMPLRCKGWDSTLWLTIIGPGALAFVEELDHNIFPRYTVQEGEEKDGLHEGADKKSLKQEDGQHEGGAGQSSIKQESIEHDEIKPESIKQEDIKQESSKRKNIKHEDSELEDGLKQTTFADSWVKQEDVKQESVKKESIKRERD